MTDIAIYNDPNNGPFAGMGLNKDYDAVTWTSPVIGSDSFYIEMPINELQVNDSSLYEMKVLLIQQNGNTSANMYHYYFANDVPVLNDAAFSPITGTITASAGTNGTISPPGVTTINCAGNQTYTITANSGYVISDVLVDGVSQGPVATTTLTNVAGAHTISASFSTPLPITLLYFNAALKGKNNALLNWKTASELNNKGYEVEMSIDHVTYKSAAFVQSMGTTSNTNNYSTTIPNLLPGVYSFRLKIIDENGQFTYSPVRVLHVAEVDNMIIIYPNPSTDGFIYIDVKGGTRNITLKLTNAFGQLISKTDYTNYSNSLKIKMPAPGTYNIQLIMEDGTIIVRKLVSLQ